MPRLLIFEPAFRRLEARLAAHGPTLECLLIDAAGRLTLAGAEIPPQEARPDAAWANSEILQSSAARAFMITLLKAPGLAWLQSSAAGFDDPVFAQLVGKGVRLTTSHGQAVGMADYVLAGVLDHFQGGPARRAAQAEGAWRPAPFREIMGSVWLLVGFGAVGQAVAARARGFGATIIGVRRDRAAHPLADTLAMPSAVAGLLPTADVVVLSAPLSAATRHIADGAFFAAMKAESVLVNVGRGALVDEVALLEALSRGRPAHAVLDVFETEPLPPGHPFWRHGRVALTAHASGMTGGQDIRNEALFLDNLTRFLAGEPLLREADPRDVLASRGVPPRPPRAWGN